MKKGPPTADELPHIVSIRNALRFVLAGREEWSADTDEAIAEVLRVFAMSKRRKRKSEREWERQKGLGGG